MYGVKPVIQTVELIRTDCDMRSENVSTGVEGELRENI